MAFHPPGIKGLIALQLAIDGHQHLFERLGGEAGQAVAQGVVAKRTGGPDVLLELGLSEIGLEFFEAAQAEDENTAAGGISGSWRASRSAGRASRRWKTLST